MTEKVDWFKWCRDFHARAALTLLPAMLCLLGAGGLFFASCFGVCQGKGWNVLGVAFLIGAFLLYWVSSGRSAEGLYYFRDKLCEKEGDLVRLQTEKLMLKEQRNDEEAFRRAFNPTPDQVNLRLRELAFEVHRACKAEVRLLDQGVSIVPSTIPEAKDPEENAEQFRKRSDLLRAVAKKEIQEAKDAFWRFWKLASDRDYLVKRSWRPYAELPWDSEKAPADKDFPFRDRGDGVGLLVPRGHGEVHVGVKI